jgi:hypothetical protein
MRTTKEDIKRWIKRGKDNGIVVCDSFDYEDYPVYVKPGENVRGIEKKYMGKEMQMVMEVYNLSLDIDKQMNERRSFNY